MKEVKHTKGPWKAVINESNYWEVVHPWPNQSLEEANSYSPTVVHVCLGEGDEQESNARLISAAPELLEALQRVVDNADQSVFEDWLSRNCPSGDSEQVHQQWIASAEYEDFCIDWLDERAAIAKALGN